MSLTMENRVSIQRSLIPEEVVKNLINTPEWRELQNYGPDDLVDDLLVTVEFAPGYDRPGSYWTPPEGEDPEILQVKILDESRCEISTDVLGILTEDQYDRLVREAWDFQNVEGGW